MSPPKAATSPVAATTVHGPGTGPVQPAPAPASIPAQTAPLQAPGESAVPAADSPAAQYVLPGTIVGRVDLARLIREIEAIENELESQRVHDPNHQQVKTQYKMPKLSRSLNDFVELNKLDLADDQLRTELRKYLTHMKDRGAGLHMTFAIDPDTDFMQLLVTWVRQEIHPQALISVGLQPSLVGGMYLRTPNHVHDFSLKTLLKDKRPIIVQELEKLHGE